MQLTFDLELMKLIPGIGISCQTTIKRAESMERNCLSKLF